MGGSNSPGRVRRIAILNPLNDYGIAAYTHEFAEGLAKNGHLVSVYSDINPPVQELPSERHYELYPVLGKALLRQIALPRLISSIHEVQSRSVRCSFRPASYMLSLTPAFQGGGELPVQSVVPFAANLAGRRAVSMLRPLRASEKQAEPTRTVKSLVRNWLRVRYLSSELAYHLRIKNYDLVWTQWYSPDVFDSAFWRACRKLKLPVIHTVHNVLPHEPVPGDWKVYNEVYENSKVLIVHSDHSQAELQNEFPSHASKSLVMPHGTYSTVHKRNPQCREQVRQALGIDVNSPVLLFCGAIRPYKNIEAVIEALARPEFSEVTLVIAGKESKYPDSNPKDPLGRTKMLLAKFRVACRVRVISKALDTAEMSELFEASDVLLLPYLKAYGSGLLLLGITFGKHIVATPAGGAEEYLQSYGNHTLLAGPSAPDLALGFRNALAQLRRSPVPAEPPLSLSWPHVSARVMENVERRLVNES